MKARKLVTFTLWSFFVIGAASLNAQSAHELRVNIPFEFNVSNRTVPPGDYIMHVLANALQIRQRDGHVVALTPSTASTKAEAAKEAQVMFHRYGDEYFLSEVVMPYSNSGIKLVQSKNEQKLAQDGTKGQDVAVTVRNR